jgi:hypothetical protein
MVTYAERLSSLDALRRLRTLPNRSADIFGVIEESAVEEVLRGPELLERAGY